MKVLILFFGILFCVRTTMNPSAGADVQPAATLPNDSTEYLKRAIQFIKDLKGDEMSDPSFILKAEAYTFENLTCLGNPFDDTLTFSFEEMTLIADELDARRIKKWTREMLPGVRFVSRNTIDSVLIKNRNLGWDYFHQHIGKGFRSYSAPVFLRDNTHCLFYSDNRCGSFCGSGSLVLYKKQKRKWVEVKKYCMWITR